MHRLTILVATTFLSGCIVLPIPHRRIHEYGVKGKIVDENGLPVSRAWVCGTMDLYPKATRTDEQGNFTLPVNRGWHGAIMIGPIIQSMLPGLDITQEGRVIIVSPQGKPSCALIIGGKHQEDDIIHAGEIHLPPPAPAR